MRRLPIGIRPVPALLALIGISMAGAPSALAFTIAPPPWWSEGRALIERGGGTCQNFGITQFDGSGGPGVPVGAGRDCLGRIPREVRQAVYPKTQFFGPPFQKCRGQEESFTNSTPAKSLYVCAIYANPGTFSRPNTASWVCERIKQVSNGVEFADGWRALATPIFAPIRNAPTLAGCLAPRAALDEPTTPASQARGKGVKLPVTCSHTCKVAVTGGARRVSTTLRAGGKRTVLRIPLRGAVATLRISVSAAGYRARATVRARTRGATVRIDAPDTLSLKR